MNKFGEAFDPVDVGAVGHGREAVDGHAVDQALAKWAGDFVGNGEVLSRLKWRYAFSRQDGQDFFGRVMGWFLGVNLLRPIFFCAIILSIGACMPSSDARSAPANNPIGKETQTLSLPSEISGIAWSLDGKHLAAEGMTRRVVYMWDIRNDRELWRIPKVMAGHKQCLLFSRDGKFLIIPSVVAVGMNNLEMTVSLISAETGQIVQNLTAELLPNTANGAASCSLSADGQVLAVLGQSGRVVLYETKTWQILGYVGPAQYSNGTPYGSGSHIAVDTVHGLLVFGGILGEAQTWDIASNRRLVTFRAYDVGGIYSMTLNPITGGLLTGGDGEMKPNMPAPGKPLLLEGAPQDDPNTLVRLWDPRTGNRTGVYSGPGIEVADIAFSPDGRYIAATKGRWIGRKSSYALVWNAADGKLIAAKRLWSIYG